MPKPSPSPFLPSPLLSPSPLHLNFFPILFLESWNLLDLRAPYLRHYYIGHPRVSLHGVRVSTLWGTTVTPVKPAKA
ncbi:hypothetical protein N7471_008939 [Penicillium samsonianum]|uniref:uncharacterized protein n=1 Tax=Penicillium samsonianum TaxID=1882272 RepID=UPI0025491CA7|nr:uncharacterized protein N7471_008939 [Penicillium samsonianum]KAJ6127722.1 hypothetical protein N7471_008939 [Penicillium samsonianum]